MDYSLLVGIHFKHISTEGEIIPIGSQTPTGNFLILYEVIYNLNVCVWVCPCFDKNLLVFQPQVTQRMKALPILQKTKQMNFLLILPGELSLEVVLA